MNKRNILYGAIILVCLICIILVVYDQFFAKNVVNENKINVIENDDPIDDPVDDPSDVLTEFNKLFTNSYNSQNNSIKNVKKLNEDEDLIWEAWNLQQEANGKYSVDIKLPAINIDSNVVASLNGITQTKFADKVSEILNKSDKYTIYNIDYTAYLNDNILSLVIKATLKEGTNAQKVMVQTYNYDVEKDEKVSLNQIIEKYGYKSKDVNKKIEKQVEEASKRATVISQATGQIVYKRIINSSIYTTDNASNFFIGKDGQIYIVYAYGNDDTTSEMDIIKI